ncbi:hypothetical protein [Parashewanella tropica]|uniref:hypothetical protein n=1 Tax=Parashewanella tropica TaxID=2547970 RepID=UPI00105960DA|nr:hypothetical protein [Parashewanella tropica]
MAMAVTGRTSPTFFDDGECEDLGYVCQPLSTGKVETLEQKEKAAKEFFDTVLFKFFSRPEQVKARLLFINIVTGKDPQQTIFDFTKLKELAGAFGDHIVLEIARQQSSTSSTPEDSSSSGFSGLVDYEFQVKPNPIITTYKFFPVCVMFGSEFDAKEAIREHQDIRQSAISCASKTYHCFESCLKPLGSRTNSIIKRTLEEIYQARTSHQLIQTLKKLNSIQKTYHFDVLALSEDKENKEVLWQLTAIEITEEVPKFYYLQVVQIQTPKAVFEKEQELAGFIDRLITAKIIPAAKNAKVIQLIGDFVFEIDVERKRMLENDIGQELKKTSRAQVKLEPEKLLYSSGRQLIVEQPLTLWIGDFKITSQYDVAILAARHYHDLAKMGLIDTSQPSTPMSLNTLFSLASLSHPTTSSAQSSPTPFRGTSSYEQVDKVLRAKHVALRVHPEARENLKTITSQDADIDILVQVKKDLNRFLIKKGLCSEEQPAITTREIEEEGTIHTIYEFEMDGVEVIELTRRRGSESEYLKNVQKRTEEGAAQVEKQNRLEQQVEEQITKLEAVARVFYQCHPQAGHPLSEAEKELIKSIKINQLKEQHTQTQLEFHEQHLAGLRILDPRQLPTHCKKPLGEFAQMRAQMDAEVNAISEASKLPHIALYQSQQDVEAMFQEKGVLVALFDNESREHFQPLCAQSTPIATRVKCVQTIADIGFQLTDNPDDVQIVLTPKCQVVPATDKHPEYQQFFIIIELIDHTKDVCTPLCIIPVLANSDESRWLDSQPSLTKQNQHSQTVSYLTEAQDHLTKLQLQVTQHQTQKAALAKVEEEKQQQWLSTHEPQLKSSEQATAELTIKWPQYVANVESLTSGQLSIEPIYEQTLASASEQYSEIFTPLEQLSEDTVTVKDFTLLKQQADMLLAQLERAQNLILMLSKIKGQHGKTDEYQRVSTAISKLQPLLKLIENLQKPTSDHFFDETKMPGFILFNVKKLLTTLKNQQSSINELSAAIGSIKPEYQKLLEEVKAQVLPTVQDIQEQFNVPEHTNQIQDTSLAIERLLSTVEAVHNLMEIPLDESWSELRKQCEEMKSAARIISEIAEKQRIAFAEYSAQKSISKLDLENNIEKLEEEIEQLKEHIVQLEEQVKSETQQQCEEYVKGLVSKRKALAAKVKTELEKETPFEAKRFYQSLGREFDSVLAPAYAAAS